MIGEIDDARLVGSSTRVQPTVRWPHVNQTQRPATSPAHLAFGHAPFDFFPLRPLGETRIGPTPFVTRLKSIKLKKLYLWLIDCSRVFNRHLANLGEGS